MYIRTGLAPISDESAHNQGKKAKNLRYPYPSDIVLKKEKNKNLISCSSDTVFQKSETKNSNQSNRSDALS